MKKKMLGLVGGILLGGLLLTGCGAEKPSDTVNNFLTSYQKGDLKKASEEVDGDLNKLQEKTGQTTANDTKMFKDMLSAVAKKYKFETPTDVSQSGDTAMVKVKVTSVDVGEAFISTIKDVMPAAFASAFSGGDSKDSEKAMQDMTAKELMKNLKDKKTSTVTKTVTLNLKKNKDGKYKIQSDKNLLDVILPNIAEVSKMFGSDNSTSGTTDNTSTDQPERKIDVLKTIATNQSYTSGPIKLTINEIDLKKLSNVPDDEASQDSLITGKNVGKVFNYIYIKYTSENTSTKDIQFTGIDEAVLFTGQNQERIDNGSDNANIVNENPDKDHLYYGKVKKQGEVGFIIDSAPENVDKLRIVIGQAMDNETYDSLTEPQKVEFKLK
jgi:hypothetical protein